MRSCLIDLRMNQEKCRPVFVISILLSQTQHDPVFAKWVADAENPPEE